MTIPRTRIPIVPVTLVMVLLASCAQEGHPPLHPVHGQAFFHKKPATEAVIVLRPVSPGPLQNTLPHGTVGPDGSFQIETYMANDGAPVGEYIVTVTWPHTRTEPTGDLVTIDRLKGRFADPAQSRWKIVVQEGSNTLETFQLD